VLHINKNDLPVGKFDMGNTAFTTTIVHGNNVSMMFATRPSGYHSKPHIHDCEQVNICLKGENIVFLQGQDPAFLKEGDINRIPAGVIHWAWVTGSEPFDLLEIHSPGLQSDPKCKDYAVAMYADGEEPSLMGEPINLFTDPDEDWVQEMEKKAVEMYGDLIKCDR